MNNALTKTLTARLNNGLKVKLLNGYNTDHELIGITNKGVLLKGIDEIIHFKNISPYLFPMSALAKEIEFKGERFVPIQRLFELMRYPENSYICEKMYSDGNAHCLKYKLDHAGSIKGRFWYHDIQQCFLSFESDHFARTKNQLEGFELLKSWHFNIYNLSPDEFIEVNETNNPYAK